MFVSAPLAEFWFFVTGAFAAWINVPKPKDDLDGKWFSIQTCDFIYIGANFMEK